MSLVIAIRLNKMGNGLIGILCFSFDFSCTYIFSVFNVVIYLIK